MKVAMNGRKLFLTLLTSFSVLGVGTLAIVNPEVLAGAPKPDYSLSVPAQTVEQPTSGTTTAYYSVSMVPTGGYSTPVNLAYKGLPPGVTASWPSTPAVDPSAAAPLEVYVPSSLKVGTYTFTVTGTDSAGKNAHDTKVTLGVAASSSSPPSFSLTLDPVSQTVQIPNAATYTVRLLGNATGNVTLTAKGLPGGTTAAWNPPTNSSTAVVSTTARTAVLSVSTTPKTHVGSYHFTVTGTSGKSHFDVAGQLTVQTAPGTGFTVAVSPNQQQIAAGASATYAVGVARSASLADDRVQLSVSGLPADLAISWQFSPVDVDGTTVSDSATLTLTTNEASTPDGTFEFTINGVDADSPSATASVKARIVVNTPPGKTFGISGSAAGDNLVVGGPAETINLALSNPNDKAILISSLVVSVGSVTPEQRDASKPACTAGDFSIAQYSGGYPIRIEKKSTQTLASLGVPEGQRPSVRLADNQTRNQDNCQDVTVTLSYAGNAREAG